MITPAQDLRCPSSHELLDRLSARTAEQREAMLLAEMERRGKVAPPTAEQRTDLINQEHLRGHFGRDVIYRQLASKGYWWPGMRNDILTHVRDCIPCLRFNIAKQGFAPAIPITAELPFDHIQLDTATSLPPSRESYTVLLVVIDVCTGFVLLRPLVNKSAGAVAITLWYLFNDFGFPRVIQSDQGTEFVNAVIRELCRTAHIDQRVITRWHPRADGRVERTIGLAWDVIKKELHGVKENWPMFVPWAQSCLNNKISELTGASPFQLFFGRHFNPLIDHTSDPPRERLSETELKQMNERMIKNIFPMLHERVKAKRGDMVRRLAKRVGADQFRKGAIVMLRRRGPDGTPMVSKTEPIWDGPYMITNRTRHSVISLQDSLGNPIPTTCKPHHLKYVSGPTDTFLQTRGWVERILKHRGVEGSREYLIRWVGYPPEADEWVRESDIDADDCITDYWQRQGIKQPTARKKTTSSTDTHTDTDAVATPRHRHK